MNISLHKRSAKALGTVVATAGLLLGAGAGTAAAGPSGVTFKAGSMQSDGSRSISVHRNGHYVGKGWWKANGDTLYATDSYADGYGVSAYLGTAPVRVADTLGHHSPYTKSVGGNLREDRRYTFWVCIGNNKAGLTCSDIYTVTS
ncbi:hypothetical protein JS756_21385 [Streptomyces actuosus]|uniref:Secreted protein n=1 Tax=Streptomyces actuosus TaxID=1885 RepID=A0ABS2VU88_STRAS|nr:hypothetical protein [Streptomyces actuosus]MBN0046611.1 hypothetical protein [Streptomyces actuosus]